MECGMENTAFWMYNDIRLQAYNSSVCGYYVIGYCIAKMDGLGMEDCVNLFSSNSKINDTKIYNFIKSIM